MNSNQLMERPQPAPRLSITKANQNNNILPIKIDSISHQQDSESNSGNNCTSHSDSANNPLNNSNSPVGGSNNESEIDLSSKGPPPLPPKPKVLPMKPSNWGQGGSTSTNGSTPPPPSKIPIDINRRHLNLEQNNVVGQNIYLDQPSSSFV